MPTISALNTVSANELPGLDTTGSLPVVSNGQTKKLRFSDLRETLIPKVLQQAVAGNTDELTFNNPSSIKVDVYGRVTAVSEGSGTPVRIEGIQMDPSDFDSDGTVRREGTPLITHRVRFPTLPTTFQLLPPFSATRTGHLLSGTLAESVVLYNQRNNEFINRAQIGLGSYVAPDEVNPTLLGYLNSIEASTTPPSLTYDDFYYLFRAIVQQNRGIERTNLNLMDRLNRVMYVLNKFLLGFAGGYDGINDVTNIEHRSPYEGLYYFSPRVLDDLATPLVSNGLTTTANFYRLKIRDGASSQPQGGDFSNILWLSPSENANSRVWLRTRIDAVYTPMAAFAPGPGTPGGFSWGGFTSGQSGGVLRTYLFTRESIAAGGGANVPAGSANWTVETISGSRFICLQSPTVAELRVINSSFATGLDGAATGSDDHTKNSLAISLNYSAVADAQWIRDGVTPTLPSSMVGQTKTYSFGNSGLFFRLVNRVN